MAKKKGHHSKRSGELKAYDDMVMGTMKMIRDTTMVGLAANVGISTISSIASMRPK